ncbi:ABC transporter substrate-binding protein [Frondihabitans sp. VKM Ac-2883]|uniref:ABC transporter substrate-binding protein n=1 Tax=Frondihabitans sp. VKM Ac-2883 TaxID=2783823 RepID=UPI00188B1261|nr:ABC transporter substrate-binding protein [Frondihabitans sp. VKM Ac-2883]MBF4577276.1 ABC transporter substrate-binding protein [Frondihabitans sp. VKM Ac-2883]
MHLPKRALAGLGLVAVSALALSACSSDSGATTDTKTTSAAAAVDLSSVCPANVVIQTDWNPEADHGHLYELLGDDYKVDASKKSVSGTLMSGGKSTGVQVEIRSGGPAIGYASVSSQMYQDKDIMLGYVTTDEGVQNSAKLPTTAVMAENDISPQMIMWDPATYPDVTTIKELGAALEKNDGVVRYFGGSAYMEYLIGNGILPKSVTDGSYDGTPSKFVVAKGNDAQQGFATAEPFIYKNQVSAWGKDVKYQLVNDTGYPIYPEAMSVRTGDLTKLSPCLKKLVPVLQQADVDYITNPGTTNKLVADLVTQYNNGWVYDEDVANYGVETMKKLKIASNGDNDYVGDMDTERIQKVIDIDTPIYEKSGTKLKSGLAPEDLFTNEFIDKSIGF